MQSPEDPVAGTDIAERSERDATATASIVGAITTALTRLPPGQPPGRP